MIKYKVNASKQSYIWNIDWLHQQKVNMEIKQENTIKHSVYGGLVSLYVFTSSQQTYLNLKPLFVRVFPNWYILPVSQTSPISHTWGKKICALIAI